MYFAGLETERQEKSISPHISIWDALRSRNVLCLPRWVPCQHRYLRFLPLAAQHVHKASTLSPAAAATLSGIPFASAVLAVLCISYSSDRSGERRLHTAIPLILAAAIFPVTTMASLSFTGLLCWLSLSAAAIYAFGPSYWTIPSQKLTASAGAAAFGFLNLSSGLGSFVGPSVVGNILTAEFSFSVAVMFLSACFLVAGLSRWQSEPDRTFLWIREGRAVASRMR